MSSAALSDALPEGFSSWHAYLRSLSSPVDVERAQLQRRFGNWEEIRCAAVRALRCPSAANAVSSADAEQTVVEFMLSLTDPELHPTVAREPVRVRVVFPATYPGSPCQVSFQHPALPSRTARCVCITGAANAAPELLTHTAQRCGERGERCGRENGR